MGGLSGLDWDGGGVVEVELGAEEDVERDVFALDEEGVGGIVMEGREDRIGRCALVRSRATGGRSSWGSRGIEERLLPCAASRGGSIAPIARGGRGRRSGGDVVGGEHYLLFIVRELGRGTSTSLTPLLSLGASCGVPVVVGGVVLILPRLASGSDWGLTGGGSVVNRGSSRGYQSRRRKKSSR